jgi:spore coat protein U-like protein
MAVALLCGTASGPAAAGSAGAQFNVTTTVLSACSVSATDLTFGNYAASSASPTDASNTLSVTCTSALPYTVALDGGTTAGSVAARKMSDGASHTLNYFLYTGSNHTTLWGDGNTGTSTVGGTGSGSTQNLTVYGRIPNGQFVTAGSYTDRVTVTVSY